MRYFALFLALTALMFCTSCGGGQTYDRLAYQRDSLYIEAEFTIDGEAMTATLDLDAPEYDENGRMLARNAVLTIGENSIISGVSFELTGDMAYVCSGALKIPLEDERVISGISDIVSLFCIDGDCYYSSKDIEGGGMELRLDTYVNGSNRVEVTMDTSCELPVSITAAIGERELSVDIKVIKAE